MFFWAENVAFQWQYVKRPTGGDNLPDALFRELIEEEALWVQFTLAERLLLAELADKSLLLSNSKTHFCVYSTGVRTYNRYRLLRQDELPVVSKVGSGSPSYGQSLRLTLAACASSKLQRGK